MLWDIKGEERHQLDPILGPFHVEPAVKDQISVALSSDYAQQ